MEATVQRELYGGAILVQLPPRFADVSDFRPVPDHQEVWADAGEDQSLVVEIVEHDAAVADADCARHMWQDQVAGNQSVSDTLQGVQALSQAQVPLIPAGRWSYGCVASGLQAVSKGRQGAEAANQVAVLLAVLRLPSVRSDLLLTLNSPVTIAPQSQAAEHAGAGAKLRHAQAPALMLQLLASLQIVDWSLFGT